MEKVAPGKTLLLVTGIISIILGVITLFTGASMIYSISTINTDSPAAVVLRETMAKSGTTQGDMMQTFITSIVLGILYFLVGIIGIIFSKRIEKAQICFVLGLIMVASVLIEAVISLVAGSFVLWMIVLSLIIPLLYLWGAIRNKQAVDVKA